MCVPLCKRMRSSAFRSDANLVDSAGVGWQDLQRQFMGEQLVYIAGLAVDAQIVYGDRVKADTYRRLDTIPSIVDLDRAFGLQVEAATSDCDILQSCTEISDDLSCSRAKLIICALHP